jgi:hypothetical protein
LSKKDSKRPFHSSKKQRPVPNKGKLRTEEKTLPEKEEEVVSLVRRGVEEFIMDKATIEEFLRKLRALTDDENHAHQLTGPALRKIVREAIRKKNLARTPK